MQSYIKDEVLHNQTLDTLISLSLKGGQNADGSQKDGLLKYEKGKPVAVFNIETMKYQPIEEIKTKIDSALGQLPENLQPWKAVIGNKTKDSYLREYFSNLKKSQTYGARLAIDYHLNSKNVAEKLVSSGVALNAIDVNTVLMTGFFHAYGPINDFI